MESKGERVGYDEFEEMGRQLRADYRRLDALVTALAGVRSGTVDQALVVVDDATPWQAETISVELDQGVAMDSLKFQIATQKAEMAVKLDAFSDRLAAAITALA